MTTQTTQGKSRESRIVFAGEESSEGPLRASVRTALKRYFKDLNGHRPAGLYELVMNEVEQPLLETVMAHTRGNQSQAAAILGINRNTLRKKLKQHGLD
jgi:Fis family transcriptional regulator